MVCIVALICFKIRGYKMQLIPLLDIRFLSTFHILMFFWRATGPNQTKLRCDTKYDPFPKLCGPRRLPWLLIVWKIGNLWKMFCITTGWNEAKFVKILNLWSPFKIVFVDPLHFPRRPLRLIMQLLVFQYCLKFLTLYLFNILKLHLQGSY